MKRIQLKIRRLFFNPLKFGATKILEYIKGLPSSFFNPLKFGATKIRKRKSLSNTWFFNPLKFGATKIVKSIKWVF